MDAGAAVLLLAEALLPGGEGFPGFEESGAGALLLGRLGGEVMSAVGSGAGAAALEAAEPGRFAEFRKQAYLAYYEQPSVIAAIRALGHPYNDAPLPDGYPTAAFDPAVDAPLHQRGRWVAAEDVRRVDLGGLGLERLP